MQSTNEELETAKEELQSGNEELVTLNEQLQNRNAELAVFSDDLANLLGGVNIPIVMLDNERRIRRFTPTAEKLLNLLPGDVGRPFSNIRPNIQVQDLEILIKEVVDSITVRERDVQDGEGRWYTLRIRPYRTMENKIDGVTMVFLDIDESKRIQVELREERDFASAVLDGTPAPVLVLTPEGRIVRFNRSCQQVSGYSIEEVRGKCYWDVLSAPESIRTTKAAIRQVATGREVLQGDAWWLTKAGQRRLIAFENRAVCDEGGQVKYIIRAGIDITEHRKNELALAEADAAGQRSQEELHRLMSSVLTAQEEERRRVSRELHDDFNQQLARLTMEMEVLERQPPAPPHQLRTKLRGLLALAVDLSEGIRRTAHRLHPAVIETLGLAPALKSYCADFSRKEGVKVRFTQRDVSVSIPPEIALCLYRVTQEALRNVTKHSGASHAWVALRGNGGSVDLRISDTGVGFDLQKPKPKGLGIVSMQERVLLAGGELSIHSEPRHGVRLDVHIPLPAKKTKTGRRPKRHEANPAAAGR